MTGFDPSLVTNSINKVESAYSELMQALYSDMQNNFVDTMAQYWACNLAQRYFRDFVKPDVDNALKDSFARFESVVSSMNEAAARWAQDTESEWAPMSFQGELKTISVDSIQENINGVRGVDEANANTTATELQKIAQNSNTALEAAKSAVNNCGFVGRDMEVTLIQSLDKIKNIIDSFVTEITNGIRNEINETVEAYGTLATKVEDAFSGGGQA